VFGDRRFDAFAYPRRLARSSSTRSSSGGCGAAQFSQISGKLTQEMTNKRLDQTARHFHQSEAAIE
jgi:hypothetical protein